MNLEKDQWVEGVLAAAENIERAKAPSHFYTRTIARIKAEAGLSREYILRIAAGLVLLVALNVFACIGFSKGTQNNGNLHLQAFANEYGLTGSADSF